MINNALTILKRKHLIIVGKSEIDRTAFINQIISRVDYSTFRFPKGIKTLYDYIDFVRANKLYEAWYSKKGKFRTNQILDFHRDWISESKNSLIIMEEFQEMEQGWNLDILRSYMDEIAFRTKNQKAIHLIITLESENNLLENLSKAIGQPDDNRTQQQIVNGAFELLDLGILRNNTD